MRRRTCEASGREHVAQGPQCLAEALLVPEKDGKMTVTDTLAELGKFAIPRDKDGRGLVHTFDQPDHAPVAHLSYPALAVGQQRDDGIREVVLGPVGKELAYLIQCAAC